MPLPVGSPNNRPGFQDAGRPVRTSQVQSERNAVYMPTDQCTSRDHARSGTDESSNTARLDGKTARGRARLTDA